ncbi:MAG: hypothetical protein AAGF79_21205 [Pseudomonadota bacterium]
MFVPRLTACLTSVALAVAPPLAAQSVPGALYTVVVPTGQFGSSAYLTHVLQGLAAARAFCTALNDPSLNIDCLAERLSDLSDAVPEDSDYAEVRSVLNDASTQLSDLARANRDSTRGRVTATQPGPEPGTVLAQTSRPLVPVSPAALPGVNRDAVAILDEAETVLLRSAEASSDKRTQYTRIADAIDSNKVLLRST